MNGKVHNDLLGVFLSIENYNFNNDYPPDWSQWLNKKKKRRRVSSLSMHFAIL